MADRNGGLEAEKIEKPKTSKIPYWRTVIDQGVVTQEVIDYPYKGSGTEDDPYAVEWIPNDPRNPMQYGEIKKWSITMCVAFATLAVALVSSAYTGGIDKIMVELHIGQEVATLGVSLFVLGFAIGPLMWAPMSELFGRQVLFIGTYAGLTAFNAGCAGAQNAQTLIILRFFAGAFGSSPLTNAGGVIADMFPAAQRGLAMSVFAAAPFLGPVLGPIIGGFLGMNAGWRWVEGFLAAFSGTLWIVGSLLLPETYAPVLLRRRAERLSKITGKVYRSKLDIERGKVTLGSAFKTSLSRPWILLFREPIVFLLSVYMAIIYGTLYMLFAAYPIVYQRGRGWNPGVGSLPFLGIMVGMLAAVIYTIPDNKRYIRTQEQHGGFAPPEARLMASIAAGVPFGFGMVLVFLSIMNYLIDAYTIFAASVLAANSVLRSCFGAAFPLFTTYMYNNLGIHWASSIPAFLAVACIPFPFLFYKYGPAIRTRCKFAAQSEEFLRKLQQQGEPEEEAEEEIKEAEAFDRTEASPPHSPVSSDSESAVEELPSVRHERSMASMRSGSLRRSQTGSSVGRTRSLYEGNPYDIDRVNTRESFKR
ncbi:hypothetical protein DTO212C5_1097 [Paecilomyces variotii]|nr:hypothetical protein DTO212C5_1097 [Paecilomyces variotii]